MQKLQTPILYEDTLDGLNTVRPLRIEDKVENVLDIPILASNPAGRNTAIKGKLLRCDENGALLKCNQIGVEYDDVQTFELFHTAPRKKIYFPRLVSHIVFYRMTNVHDIALHHITWQGISSYANQNPLRRWLIKFGCKQIRVMGIAAGSWSITVGCAFVYKR